MSAPAQATAKPDAIKQLMIEMGAQDGGQYLPRPIDQNAYARKYGSAEERALSWIEFNTVGRKRKREFCIDEHGHAVGLKRLAADCGWSERTARNVVAQLESEGRAELKEGRIYYRAFVPIVHERRTNGEQNDSVQSHPKPRSPELPSYLVESIEKLAPEVQPVARARFSGLVAWQREVMAETVAMVRVHFEQIEDSMWRDFGVKRNRIKKRRACENRHVQLSLLSAPDFVQSHRTEASYSAENGFVQSAHPLSPTEADAETAGRQAGSKSSGSAADPPACPPAPPPPQAPEPAPDAHETGARELWMQTPFAKRIPHPEELQIIAAALADTAVPPAFAAEEIAPKFERRKKPKVDHPAKWMALVIREDCAPKLKAWIGKRDEEAMEAERARRAREQIDREQRIELLRYALSDPHDPHCADMLRNAKPDELEEARRALEEVRRAHPR